MSHTDNIQEADRAMTRQRVAPRVFALPTSGFVYSWRQG
jgi:hypothetical protein